MPYISVTRKAIHHKVIILDDTRFTLHLPNSFYCLFAAALSALFAAFLDMPVSACSFSIAKIPNAFASSSCSLGISVSPTGKMASYVRREAVPAGPSGQLAPFRSLLPLLHRSCLHILFVGNGPVPSSFARLLVVLRDSRFRSGGERPYRWPYGQPLAVPLAVPLRYHWLSVEITDMSGSVTLEPCFGRRTRTGDEGPCGTQT
eukprot:COSAG02_NODE_2098_length_9831_cov_17.592581_9_plen_203_part_00